MIHLRCWQLVAALGFATVLFACPLTAQIAYGPDFDPNDNGDPVDDLMDPFGVTDIDVAGDPGYTLDDMFQEPDGNDAAALITGFMSPGLEQSALVNVHISNGENGSDVGEGLANIDLPNPEPPDAIFTTIGNPSGQLENGNVVRYSMWMRSDPNDPVIVPPQIEPIVKLEFWTEARSRFGDFNPGDNPTFGDRVFDTDQNGICTFGDPGEVCATFVDMDGDGFANGSSSLLPPDATLSTDEWTLVSTEYEVDDTNWGYEIDDTLIPKTVADVEEIRPVMFLGDFAGTDLTDGGTLLIDNPMLEIYRTAADVPGAIPNPTPGPTASVSGDFNNDGNWDCTDIDALVAEVAGMTGNLAFDMNNDGNLDFADVEEWLVVGGAENPAQTNGNAFLVGDATLDGVVDGLDFIEWNNNKFTGVAAWCSGDFNADGIVDGLDFIDWNANKFTSSGDVAAVPEPAGLLLLAAGLLMARIRRQ